MSVFSFYLKVLLGVGISIVFTIADFFQTRQLALACRTLILFLKNSDQLVLVLENQLLSSSLGRLNLMPKFNDYNI